MAEGLEELAAAVTTRLATFEGRSKFMTWNCTIATRMLHHLPFANHPRIADPIAFARAAGELDELVAIGSLYQSDHFAAPAAVWDGIQNAFPHLIGPESA